MMRRRVRSAISVVKEAVDRFGKHHGDTLGAALAFQTLLALAPLLVVAVAILARILGEGEARVETLRAARQALGPRAQELVAGWIDAARAFSGTATAVGAVLFLYGAHRVVAQLDTALSVVLDIEERPQPPWSLRRRLLGTLKERLIALGVTLFLGVWIAVALAGRHFLIYVWPGAEVYGAIEAVLSAAVMVPALALLYRVLPRDRLAWREAFLGGAITAALLTVGAALLEIWFRYGSAGAGYGATGSVVAVLIWLFLSAQIFLLGAEISAAAVRRRRATRDAAPRPEAPTVTRSHAPAR
jgi:membrane protein